MVFPYTTLRAPLELFAIIPPTVARLAVEETRIGVREDKVIKNMVATEFVYNYVKDKRTVGAIREFPERGLVELAEPIGVIFSLIPITNPTSRTDVPPLLRAPTTKYTFGKTAAG